MNYSITINGKEELVATKRDGVYILINPLLLVTQAFVPVSSNDSSIRQVKDLQLAFSKQTFSQSKSAFSQPMLNELREDTLTNEFDV